MENRYLQLFRKIKENNYYLSLILIIFRFKMTYIQIKILLMLLKLLILSLLHINSFKILIY